MPQFVHLHVHTQYSILDGQASVQRLVDKAMADGQPGIAVTDHGDMFGIKEFYNYVQKVKGKCKDKAAEAEARIAALASSGEEDVSYSQVERRLRDWLNRRKHNKTGLIPRLEEEASALTERLAQVNPALAKQARKVLDVNKSERHIRGGLATREKYLHQH